MKNIFTTIILILFFSQIIKAQESTYNVFEINKGEILKKDYQYLEYLFDGLLVATPFKEGITDYRFENLTGVIDLSEKEIFPFQYRGISIVRDDFRNNKEKISLMDVSNGKGRGLFVYQGKEFKQITDFKYLRFRPFLFNGSFLSAYDGYCQILNLNDGNIIKTEFVETQPITRSLTATKDRNYKWGIIDKDGNTVLKNQFDEIESLSDSLIAIEKRDSIGVLNNSGRFIVPPVFSSVELAPTLIIAQTFNSGKKIQLNEKLKESSSKWSVTIEKTDGTEKHKMYSYDKHIDQTGYFGAFDFNGELKIPFEFEILEPGSSNELIASKNSKFGLITTNGVSITDFKYDNIKLVMDKFYLVEKDNKFGLLTINGKELLALAYEKIFPISLNEILVLENNIWNKYTYDKSLNQKKIENTTFNSEYSFSYLKVYSQKFKKYNVATDIFQVEHKKKFGIVTKGLQVLIPATNLKEANYYNKFLSFDGVTYTSAGTKLGNIDIGGNTYYDIEEFTDSIIGKKSEKYGVVNKEGKIVIPFVYNHIQNVDGKKFIVKK